MGNLYAKQNKYKNDTPYDCFISFDNHIYTQLEVNTIKNLSNQEFICFKINKTIKREKEFSLKISFFSKIDYLRFNLDYFCRNISKEIKYLGKNLHEYKVKLNNIGKGFLILRYDEKNTLKHIIISSN